MLTYSIEHIRGESLYIHLYKALRDDILSGKLTTGTKLPSKRSFAKHLGISVVTVENAYAQLQSEGYIHARPKSGFYVAAIESIPLPTGAGSAAPHEKKESPSLPPPRINLVSNRTSAETFPFTPWARLMRDALSLQRDALMDPSPAGGIPELRRAICQHLQQFRSMSVHPEQIIVGAGTEYLYSLLIQLLGYDKKYAVEAPGYQKVPNIYNSHRVACVHIPMDRDGLPVPLLQQLEADVAHISPSHHFPTGMVTPISRRYELLNWANQAPGRYIIEDDYDSEFRLSGKPIPTLQSIDGGERVIYMNTFTKTLAPTIRISYMVLPPHLMAEFNRRLGFYACTVSSFEQYTLAAFIRNGHLERHINRMRTHYRLLRDNLISALKESSLADRIQISNADSGLHFLLTIDTDLPDHLLVQQAAQQGLALSCLSQFYTADHPGPQHIIIVNYSGLKSQEIPLAVSLLEKVIPAPSQA